MKTLTALIIILHLCRGSESKYGSVDEGGITQSDKMRMSRDLYDLLRSFYRNRAHGDKESIENARREALKQYEKEKEEAITQGKHPNPLFEHIVSWYNRLVYWLVSKENPNYERSLEYFIPMTRCTFLQDIPNTFVEAYAEFF